MISTARNDDATFRRFEDIDAWEQASEMQGQLYGALDEGFIDRGLFDRLHESAMSTIRQISGLVKYVRSRPQAPEKTKPAT